MHAMTFLFVASTMLAADSPNAQREAGDLAKLQGSWQLVRAESRGKVVPQEQIKGIRLVVSGQRLKLVTGDGTVEGSFALDSSKTPKCLDSTINFDGDRGKTLGIYDLEGDSLKLCCSIDGKTRPKGFAATPQDEFIVWVYKRIKP